MLYAVQTKNVYSYNTDIVVAKNVLKEARSLQFPKYVSVLN